MSDDIDKIQAQIDKFTERKMALRGEVDTLEAQRTELKKSMRTVADNDKWTEQISPANIAATGRSEMIKTIIVYNVVPYLVLIAIFSLLIWGIASAAKRRVAKPSRSVAATKSVFGKMWFRIKSLFSYIFSVFTMDPGTKAFFAMLNPFGADLPSVDRDSEHNGRCDNLSYFEKGSKCQSSTKPKDFEWELDTSELPEFDKVPDEIKKRYRLEQKRKIIIPVEQTDKFYAPRCNKAYYDDGLKTPARLFEDSLDGRSCKKRVLPSQTFDADGTRAIVQWTT
jgi:FtsZ-binding cell division protein ZapB